VPRDRALAPRRAGGSAGSRPRARPSADRARRQAGQHGPRAARRAPRGNGVRPGRAALVREDEVAHEIGARSPRPATWRRGPTGRASRTRCASRAPTPTTSRTWRSSASRLSAGPLPTAGPRCRARSPTWASSRRRARSGSGWNEPSKDSRVADTALEVLGDMVRRWMAIAQCFASGPSDPPRRGEPARKRSRAPRLRACACRAHRAGFAPRAPSC
jgi:hypothetical protein